jgi:AmiR/NasT family two-component response regulator
MNALGSPRLAEDSLPGPAPPVPRSGLAESVLWGEDVDERLLLRGLLRLHRHPVVFEAATLEELSRLPTATEPRLLVVAVKAGDGAWEQDLPSVLKSHRELRPVVILPRECAELGPRAVSAGARAVVVRPFAIRDFVNALTTALDGGPTNGPRPPG